MSVDNWISLFEALGIWAGSVLVVIQLRDGNKQQQLQALAEINDINRQLLTLGFSHPQLFAVLEDKPADPVLQRRYLQLWLNQFCQIHMYFKEAVFRGEIKEGLLLELSDFLAQKNMRKHWQSEGAFYPASFQSLVEGLIKTSKEKEPPPPAAAAPKPSDT